jgi:hypothetical protein
MKIYLDNNIVVAIENKEYSIADLKRLFPSENLKFFYSGGHIFEIEAFEGSSNISKADLTRKRVETIRSIFNKNYLSVEAINDKILLLEKDPKEVLELIQPSLVEINKQKKLITLFFSKDEKDNLRKQFGADILKISNYSPSAITGYLNSMLLDMDINSEFSYLVRSVVEDKSQLKLNMKIVLLFEILDLFGYYKDKQTPSSNFARVCDAHHAFVSSYCDYIVSDDNRMRMKTQVAFSLYKISTKIIASDGKQL